MLLIAIIVPLETKTLVQFVNMVMMELDVILFVSTIVRPAVLFLKFVISVMMDIQDRIVQQCPAL